MLYIEKDLKQLFNTYVTITSVVVMKSIWKCRCFGFVNFESPYSTTTVIERDFFLQGNG